MATIKTRYGHTETISDPNDQWIFSKLIHELNSEQFEQPDEEHMQVAVGNEHWAITAQVSGLITFDNIDLLEGLSSELPEEMFLRDIPDEQVIDLWQTTVRNDKQAFLAHPWKSSLDQLPPFKHNYYRKVH